MSPEFRAVVERVDAYLVNHDFWTLWSHIAGPNSSELAYESMGESEQKQYDSLHELVYMGQPERAIPTDHPVDLRGGPDLRALIAAWRRDVS